MKKSIIVALCSLVLSITAQATDLKEGDQAPLFKSKLHTGEEFALESQRGKWVVLYFYPKADTPGCTKQACAFRDSIKKITDLNAVVYGVSVDSQEDQMKFHKKHGLKFSLVADEKGDVTRLYGSKMPLVNMSKRWTFVLDKNLVIKKIYKDVDPVKDAETVATFITNQK